MKEVKRILLNGKEVEKALLEKFNINKGTVEWGVEVTKQNYGKITVVIETKEEPEENNDVVKTLINALTEDFKRANEKAIKEASPSLADILIAYKNDVIGIGEAFTKVINLE